MEAAFVSYSLAFFFACAFERPFFHFDDMILSPKKREAKQAARRNAKQNGTHEEVPLQEKTDENNEEGLKFVDEEEK